MVEVLERPVKQRRESAVTKTFAFRCSWIERRNGIDYPDGYTYAVKRDDLESTIRMIECQGEPSCYSKHSDIKVVPVGMDFWTKIRSSRNKVFTTTRDKHPQDFEVIRK